MKIINVKDVIKNTIAMSTEDGEKLFNVIYENLKNQEKVCLSFKDIDILISHFLNEAIGKQYAKFKNWEILDKVIEYKDLDKDDLDLLINKVIPTAKNHFKDIERSEKIEIEILNDWYIKFNLGIVFDS